MQCFKEVEGYFQVKYSVSAGKTIIMLTALTALLLGPAPARAGYPQRIVSLAPNLTEIICDLGLENRIVAVTDYCDYPPAVISKPKVGGFANPSLETIVSLKPDLVVMTMDGNPQALEARLRKLKIRTYVFQARRIKELPGAIRALGDALGAKREAALRARLFEERLQGFEKRKQRLPATMIKKAIFVVQPVPLIVAGKGTVIDDAFEIIGIDNIGAAGGTGYPKFALEEIIRLAPDALFFGKGNGMEQRADPLLKRLAVLPAVRTGNVFFLDEAIYRLGPRLIDVLNEISDCLYVITGLIPSQNHRNK
jgi:iron complex transport system substrate-binding protein